MKRLFVLSLLLVACQFLWSQVQNKIHIPNIEGYLTLQCDFHMHTVFSDGLVWPTIRPDEAWREGLDAISITEHIEYQPYAKDIPTNHNRAYEIAKPTADEKNILIIKGTEITRRMPPGHLNAIFIKDVDAMVNDDWRISLKAAIDQGGFIFWNHPGWWSQQPNTTLWWAEHTELYENGWLQGIEVVNFDEYYPIAHKWCIEKNLTMLGNSDLHNPVAMDYDPAHNERRPVTLVFARERSMEGIREALNNRRTAVLFNNQIIGKERELRPLFSSSLETSITERDKNGKWIMVKFKNITDIPIILKKNNNDLNLKYDHKLILKPRQEQTVQIRISNPVDMVVISYVVENFLYLPNQGMPIKFVF